MSEFFIELFSEEVPANLQVNARKNLHESFKKFLRVMRNSRRAMVLNSQCASHDGILIQSL